MATFQAISLEMRVQSPVSFFGGSKEGSETVIPEFSASSEPESCLFGPTRVQTKEKYKNICACT